MNNSKIYTCILVYHYLIAILESIMNFVNSRTYNALSNKFYNLESKVQERHIERNCLKHWYLLIEQYHTI